MSKPTRRLTSSLIAGATALSLLTGWVTPVQAAPAAGKASVLALEGDDPAKAQALSRALQTEFAARGVGGGRDMSLAELKLTMGCDEPPSAACLGSGGKTLGVDRMIYGSLTKKGGAYALNLNVMDVGSATVQQSVNTELGAEALEAGAVQATAKDLVSQVLGPEAAPEPTTAPPPVVSEGPKEDQRKWVWGKYDAPKWKKAAVATSAALTVVSLGVAIGTYMMIRPGGKMRKDLIAAANASKADGKTSNDIEPYSDKDLCVEARTEVPGGVKNAEVTKVCNKADGLATAATAGFIATGIFAASTIVFTTLLFVHKNKPGVAKLQKHGLALGAMPLRSGGAMVGGVFRF